VDEVMSRAEQHAKDAHGMSEQDFQQHEGAIRGAIREA
jgi:predicted small metal-binding protein